MRGTRRKKVFWFFFSKNNILHFAWFLAATTASAADTAQILQAARHAAGGDAWDGVHRLRIVSQVTGGGLHGVAQTWQDIDTGRYMRGESTPPVSTFDGFDGISPWTQGRSGVAYRLGDVDARLNSASQSYRTARAWWFPDRHAASVQYAGIARENRRQFDLLQITPEGGRTFTLWIDAATHLIDRTVEPQAEDLVVTRYADYQSVAGIRLPFRITSADEVETVQHVDINPPIQDVVFDLPSGQAADIIMPAGATSVTVPIRLERGKILVPLSVNGQKPVEAEFDSGGGLILQPALLAALHLNSAGQSREGGGGEGFVAASNGIADMVTIGGAGLRHAVFKSFTFNERHVSWGLVGLEFLQRFVVRLDFDRMVMTLALPAENTNPGRAVMVPFHFQDNQPEISARLDDIAGLFAVDTGDDSSLQLLAPFARRYGLAQRYHAVLPYGGHAVTATHGVIGRAGEVALDGGDGHPVARILRPVAYISQQSSGFDADRDVSGIIGMGILRQFNVTFDYSRQQILLERSHSFGTPDVFNRAGFGVDPDWNGWKVGTVYANSPAAIAGMATGEKIRTIGGHNAATLKLADIDKLLKQPVGTRLPITVEAAGATHKIVLVLRDIL